jgi:hypothetical protein
MLERWGLGPKTLFFLFLLLSLPTGKNGLSLHFEISHFARRRNGGLRLMPTFYLSLSLSLRRKKVSVCFWGWVVERARRSNLGFVRDICMMM